MRGALDRTNQVVAEVRRWVSAEVGAETADRLLVGVGRDALALVGHLAAGLALATPAAYKQRVWTPSRLKPDLVV